MSIICEHCGNVIPRQDIVCPYCGQMAHGINYVSQSQTGDVKNPWADMEDEIEEMRTSDDEYEDDEPEERVEWEGHEKIYDPTNSGIYFDPISDDVGKPKTIVNVDQSRDEDMAIILPILALILFAASCCCGFLRLLAPILAIISIILVVNLRKANGFYTTKMKIALILDIIVLLLVIGGVILWILYFVIQMMGGFMQVFSSNPSYYSYP
ncbi:MAG: hypothetical protein J5825_01220 [Lachnospiraceae bacterium]|nr:hypothetical protein [Lachnospiraceae bacterium]